MAQEHQEQLLLVGGANCLTNDMPNDLCLKSAALLSRFMNKREAFARRWYWRHVRIDDVGAKRKPTCLNSLLNSVRKLPDLRVEDLDPTRDLETRQ